MATVLGLLLLWQFRLAVVYVLFSLALAAAFRPLATRLSGRKLAARIGLIFLYLLIVVGFGLLLTLIVGAAVGEVQQLGSQVSVRDEWREPAWLTGTSFQAVLNDRLPPPSAIFGAVTGEQGQLVLPTLLGFSQGIITILSGALVVLFLSIYWSIDHVHFERLWLSLLPAHLRGRVRDIWRTVEMEVGAYIRSEVIHSLLAGLLLGLGYWALGSPYPALLALIGALTQLIPVVGPILAVIAPLVVGLLTSVQLTLFTVLYTIIVMIALKRWVEPRLYSRGQSNPIVTIVMLIALADAFGLIGLIVAPPLSATYQILWNRLVSHPTVSEPAGRISDLKERQVQVWLATQSMEEPPPLVTSSLTRLTNLLEQAEPALKEA